MCVVNMIREKRLADNVYLRQNGLVLCLLRSDLEPFLLELILGKVSSFDQLPDLRDERSSSGATSSAR